MSKVKRIRPSYRDNIPFGVFGIDKNKLKFNELSIYRQSTNGKIHGFPNVTISDTLRKVILTAAQGTTPNIDALNQIEREFLTRLIKRSRIQIKIPEELIEVRQSNLHKTQAVIDYLKNKLMINLGEINASNDSTPLKIETSEIIKQLLSVNALTGEFADKIREKFNLS